MYDQCVRDWDTPTFSDERIAMSDGTVKCCETGVLIPEGWPYAECRGYLRDGFTSPKDYDDSQDWTAPQAIEVWRFVRSLNQRGIACFDFGAVDGGMDDMEDSAFGTDSYQAYRLIRLRWESLCRRVRKRYSEGKKPRLWPTEKASLESGEFVPELPYSTKNHFADASKMVEGTKG